MANYPFYDKQPGPERREKLNELYATWENAISSVIKGDSGWSPLIRAVTHLDKVVLELYDWAGGQGSKPTEVGYLGSAGYVSDISLAIDFRGPLGLKGDDASVSVGTVTTTAPGTNATVVNTGTTGNAVFDFEIPRGDTGPKGDAATVSVGTVTTGDAGTQVVVTNSGTQAAATFDFTIPRGDKGEQGIQGVKGDQGLKGDKGDTGTAATISVGTVTTGAAGTLVQVVNSGTSSNAVFDFTIPKGEDGSGTGDMTQAVYDSVGDGVVNAARAAPWAGITGKPAVISAGATSADARAVIDAASSGELIAGLNDKVDKVVGKQLSTEDYTAAEKSKLAGIAAGANAYTHPAKHPASIITQDENNRFVTDVEKVAWNAKQAALVSGTNIKTINGESLLGGGNLVVTGGGGGPTLQGDTSPYITQTKTYQITNYNSFSSYAVSASAGTASISGDTITFTAPATAGSVNLTLTVDGQPAVFAINVQVAPPYIPTPTPTPDNFGDPLEGGFYAGMVWGQIAQSSTSMAIATGSMTFSVPSMLVAPIVYQGQTVEVRSRANPANKFEGTVTSVDGVSLTINVTSIGGSGTFSDWSIMACHRVIVAPKTSGEHAGIALKNVQTALPTACQTLTEGFAATQAMRDADSSTVYPAAHWARNLNIGGRTDWYIPARDELELCWRNLKPVTNNSYTGTDRPIAASLNYANNGSYGDTANTHGLNNNSAPTGAAYTAGVPAQTTAAAFHTGGTEAYVFGSAYYWSSSDYNVSSAWSQYWVSSNPGRQNGIGKTNTYRVRAVRRSVV